jgi:signal transduction histidine kinase
MSVRLHARIMLVVSLAMVIPAGVVAWAAWAGVAAITRELQAERTLLARSVADHLDDVVKGDLETLQAIGAVWRSNTPPDAAREREALRAAYLRAQVFESVMLLSGSATMVWEEPARARVDSGGMEHLAVIAQAFGTGKPEVSPLVDEPRGKRVYLAVPLRDWKGRIVRVAAGAIDPESERFAGLLRPFRFGQRGSTELIDRTGTVLATTDPGRRYIKSDHGQFIEGLIRDRKSAVGTCHSCHEKTRPGSAAATATGARPGETAGRTAQAGSASAPEGREPAPEETRSRAPEVLAFVPLAVVPWGIAIRQPEAEAFGALAALTKRLALVIPAVLAVGLVFAWGAAWSIRRPIRLLTRVAARIAAGDMAEPVPPLGDDEVGRLGRSLDRMRATIRESHQTLERRVEERTRELERLYQELSERDRSRGELLRKVISAQEDERKRIARELHDETSQSLAAVAIALETASTLASGPARGRIDDAKAIAGRALDELHRLLFDLRPSVLDDLGLASAVRWYAERHLEPAGISVRCEASGLEQRLPAEIETALFRVVQEALNNVAKHSGAETVLVECAARDDVVTIEVEDDGKGFDPQTVGPSASGTGLGLTGMRERVALLGGTLTLDTSPGEGTRIAVTVPLTARG